MCPQTATCGFSPAREKGGKLSSQKVAKPLILDHLIASVLSSLDLVDFPITKGLESPARQDKLCISPGHPNVSLEWRTVCHVLDRIKENLVALDQCVLKARRGEFDQNALFALPQWI